MDKVRCQNCGPVPFEHVACDVCRNLFELVNEDENGDCDVADADSHALVLDGMCWCGEKLMPSAPGDADFTCVPVCGTCWRRSNSKGA